MWFNATWKLCTLVVSRKVFPPFLATWCRLIHHRAAALSAWPRLMLGDHRYQRHKIPFCHRPPFIQKIPFPRTFCLEAWFKRNYSQKAFSRYNKILKIIDNEFGVNFLIPSYYDRSELRLSENFTIFLEADRPVTIPPFQQRFVFLKNVFLLKSVFFKNVFLNFNRDLYFSKMYFS